MTNDPDGLQRGVGKKPKIVPPGGGEPVLYDRISTLSKALDDTGGLMFWKQRITAVGLAKSPHLMDRVIASVANGEEKIAYGIIKDAETAGGGGSSADVGTALHAMTEVLDSGRDIPATRWVAYLDEYVEATTDFEILGVEVFVVNDEIQAAGTLDRLVRLADGRVVVADLKTGKSNADRPMAMAAQVATYARGLRYDPKTGERSPLHADVDTSVGLLIHLPAAAEKPRCDIYRVDLDLGWEAAKVAAQVRRFRALTADAFVELGYAEFAGEGVPA